MIAARVSEATTPAPVRRSDAGPCDRPLAAEGLASYRHRSPYGWIMIGARDDADALREAARSLDGGTPSRDALEVWNGTAYVPVDPAMPEDRP